MALAIVTILTGNTLFRPELLTSHHPRVIALIIASNACHLFRMIDRKHRI